MSKARDIANILSANTAIATDAELTSAVSAHNSATDPHGDRANTATQISAHASAVDPHGDRANAATLYATKSDFSNTEWTSYSVSWTGAQANPSIGNGTVAGRYKQIGKTVFVTVKLITGTTTTFGTGDWRFSLPVAAQNPETVQFACSMLDNGNAWYQGTVNGTYSGFTDKTSIITDSASVGSGGNGSAAVTSGSPFTWGAGDSLMFSGSYEAA